MSQKTVVQGVQYHLRYSNCCFNDVRFDIIGILPKNQTNHSKQCAVKSSNVRLD